MWSSLLAFAAFSILLSIILFDRAQLIFFSIMYRAGQLCLLVLTIAFVVFAWEPEWIPTQVFDVASSTFSLSPERLSGSTFWLSQGLMLSSIGVCVLLILRHLTELPRVSRHLREIKAVVGEVSNDISNAQQTSAGQGAVRKAVDTMSAFFN